MVISPSEIVMNFKFCKANSHYYKQNYHTKHWKAYQVSSNTALRNWTWIYMKEINGHVQTALMFNVTETDITIIMHKDTGEYTYGNSWLFELTQSKSTHFISSQYFTKY
jgi:hypothetical protein